MLEQCALWSFGTLIEGGDGMQVWQEFSKVFNTVLRHGYQGVGASDGVWGVRWT